MGKVDREIDRILTHLRNRIRDKGFTQLQVQAELHWGRSYISQLLTKQKALRMEQILSILEVIGVNPADFFFELYGPPSAEYQGFQGDLMTGHGLGAPRPDATAIQQIHNVLDLLVRKGQLSETEADEFKRSGGKTFARLVQGERPSGRE